MKFLELVEFITKLPVYYRVMLLKKYIRRLSKGTATEIEVSPLDIRPPRFRVILIRGAREVELQRESFPTQFIDQFENNAEHQRTLKELIKRAERKLNIPRDMRYAAILMALEEHDQRHPGQMVSSLLLRELYPPYARGDMVDEADVTALAEQQLLQLYKREEADILLKDPKLGKSFVPAESDARFERVRGGESMALTILPKGREWLEKWRQHHFEVQAVKYKIMLSGIVHELENELRSIREAVHEPQDLRNRFEFIPYNGTDVEPPPGILVENTEDAAQICDIFIGVFGEFYGPIGTDGVSQQEREYRAAIKDERRGKVIWIFRPTRAGQGNQSLRKLLKEIMMPDAGLSHFTFTDREDLKLSVQRALRRYLVLRENWQLPSGGPLT